MRSLLLTASFLAGASCGLAAPRTRLVRRVRCRRIPGGRWATPEGALFAWLLRQRSSR